MESTMVIKVKYGDTLRRFNARINENEQLDLDMGGLRAKILSLFNFPIDSVLTLTYIDEDGDVVTLADDDDLHDVMRQRLKFLRVDVQLNSDKFGKPYARSSGSSTPMRSPRGQNPLPDINTGVAEVLKNVPEPLREAISMLSLDLASKVASSSPVFAEIVDCISKMGQSYLNPAAPPQDADLSTQSGASGIPVVPTVSSNTISSKDVCMQQVLLKSNPTSQSSPELDTENVNNGVRAPPVPVDLNLDPPCDMNVSGSTHVNIVSAASNTPASNDKKGSQKENVGEIGGEPVIFGESSDCGAFPVTYPSISFPNECPFNGLPVADDLPAPPIVYPRINPSKGNHFRNGAMFGMFHKGIRCDGCGAHPITGPRYKSKVKEDYDLCSICFSEMGVEADYIRIDRPVAFRPSFRHRCMKGSYDHHPWAGPSTLPHVLRGCGVKSSRTKLDSRFILDVNVLDGTMMAPFTKFTKIWRMRNNGSITWPRGVQLVWIGGDKFSSAVSAEIEIPENGVPVDGELDIAVDFTAPELPGRYISYWRMASPTGVKFGQRVWVLIQVDASKEDSFCDSFQGLNLNLPPPSNGFKGPEIIDVNVKPAVDGGFLEPCISDVASKPGKPLQDEQPNRDQELNFPINDTLLVGHGASASAPPHSPSTVSYPMIDLSEIIPPGSYGPSPPVDAPTSSASNSEDTVEKTLLKELEEMGFKQVDLNKEILRMNEYNLEQSVDDLCGVAEWDPILEELQEMGFHDQEMNKRLLKKNNGSIKRVVMDLLTGEKA